MKRRAQASLGKAPVSRLIWSMSAPAVMGVLAYNLYHMADTIFIAKGVGTNAAGGLAVSFPLFLFLSALTSTLGGGAASVISRALGEQDTERANRAVANTFGLFFCVALGVTGLGLVFLEPLLYGMGVTQTLLPYARAYTRIILLGAVASTGFSSLIRAEGSSTYAMAIWVIPITINLLLDPVLIFVFKLGIAGAAIGTVAAQCVSMGMSLYYFFIRKRGDRIRVRHFAPDFKLLREIVLIGIPSFFQMSGYSLSIILVNRVLHGGDSGDLAVSTFGIVSKISTFLHLGIQGVVQGIQPIIGYNFGKKKRGRIDEVLRKSYVILGVYGVAAFLAVLLFSKPMLSLFTADPSVRELGARILLVMGAGFLFSGIQSVHATYFQAVGKQGGALFLSLCNSLLCFAPLLLAAAYWIGPDAIWAAFPLSNLFALLLSCAMMKRRTTGKRRIG